MYYCISSDCRYSGRESYMNIKIHNAFNIHFHVILNINDKKAPYYYWNITTSDRGNDYLNIIERQMGYKRHCEKKSSPQELIRIIIFYDNKTYGPP